MRNFTEMGYETITVIRSQYQPKIRKCLDISPVLWIQTIENEDGSKEEKKYFVFSRNNCIKEIYEISQAISNYIDGIVTPCGTLLPIDNKIEFLDSEGIGLECIDGKLKFIIKAPLDASLGGTGQIIYNEGDILVGNKDGKLSILIKGEIGKVLGIKEDGSLGYIDVLKKLTCEGSDAVTENALVRWDKNGKCLKDSKSIQQDNGTTQTTSNETSYLLHQIENTKSDNFQDAAYEAVVQSNGGNPIYRLIRRLKQTWTIYSEAADNSFRISGVNEEDQSQKGDFLKIFSNGVIIGGNQTRCAAKLTKTPNFSPNQYFEIGANLPFQTIFDIDGTNNSAGLFYPGAGDGFNGAYYTTKYLDATYLIGCQFVLDITTDERIRYDFRIVYVDPSNNVLAEFPLNGIFPTSFISVNQTVRLTKESVVPNGRIKIRVKMFGGNPYINELSPGEKSFENYFGVHVLL